MAREPSAALFDPLRRLINRQTGSTLSDAQLLESFVARRDQAAFEVLVWRHGALVLSLCHRVLRDPHAAEDAFQATFLVLARKAGAIGQAESVGCWLYKVAYRIAIRLRANAVKRQLPSEPLNEVPAPDLPDDAEWRDLRPVLDDEIAKLPEKYRAPFVLCYLEGRTNEEAAAQLGCPKGTVLSRLSRGRERLRAGLARRGVALTVTALALALTRNTSATAHPPQALVHATINAALPFAMGTAAPELVSTHVAALADGVLQAMRFAHLKVAAVALLSLVALGSGIGFAAFSRGNAPATQAETRETGAALAAPNAAPRERSATRTITGDVVAVAPDGMSFTVSEPPEGNRKGELKTVVTLGANAAVKYYAVGANGAKPTVGYEVDVQFAENAKNVAAIVTFRGAGTVGRRADRVGVVTEVAKDGKAVTLELRSDEAEERGAERPKETIPFDDKTVFAYHQVGKDGAVLTVGYTIRVMFADDGKTAGKVELLGSVSPRSRGKRDSSELDGTVRRASEDGKTFVVEVPPAEGVAEPTRVTLKLGAEALLSFSNVPTGGAKIAPGMPVRVWLAQETKDVVEQASFTGTVPERWRTVSGVVVAVANDGSSYTIEQPVTVRGEEPQRVVIKLTAKTEHVYYAVGPDGAKPTVGFTANARILDGTTDTAAKITFFPPETRGK